MYLALDTSTSVLSLAFAEKDKVLFSVQSFSLSKQSENFFALLDTAMRLYAVRWEQIEGIVVGSGPGSFTGLRVGFSAVKAWMCAYHLPVWPVPSFYALFYKYYQRNPKVQCVANAMRDNLYIGDFRLRERKLKSSVTMMPRSQWHATLKRSPGYLFAGESVRYQHDIHDNALRADIVPAVDTPDAGLLFLAAFSFSPARPVTEPSRLRPLYFYPEHWQVKKKQPR